MDEKVLRVSTDFDHAMNISYGDEKITIPYDHLDFVKREIEHLIGYVEMTRSQNATIKS